MGEQPKSHDRKRPCPQPEICYAHAQPEVSQYPSGAFSPEVTSVIVCACATGIFCITTRVVVQVHGYLWPKVTRSGGRACACPTGSWLQEVTSFSRAFFLLVVQNVGWGVLYDVRVYPFPLLFAPFIFIITYKVSCFRIYCVVLQGWYL